MSNLEFFKQQAKKFLKDWKTQTIESEYDGDVSFVYDWKFFDVGDLFLHFGFDEKDEQDIKLSRAQHLIAKIVGFKKWNDLIHASEKELCLAEIVLRNIKNSEDIIEWEDTLLFNGIRNFDIDSQIEYAKEYFLQIDVTNADDFLSKWRPKTERKDLNVKPEILSGEKRRLGLIIGTHVLGEFEMDTKVKCIHCGQVYRYNESTVVLYPNEQKPLVMCKSYPSCDGSLIDMRNIQNNSDV